MVEMSSVQRTVHQIEDWTSIEQKWTAVGGAIRLYEGEVRVLDVENARWSLTTVESSSMLASSLLMEFKQFAVKSDGTPGIHSFHWLPESAKSSIEEQCLSSRLHGCWRAETRGMLNRFLKFTVQA